MSEFFMSGPLLCIAAAVVSLGRSGGDAYNKKSARKSMATRCANTTISLHFPLQTQ